jgi:FtsP/CotA-like multicopper oxidase with cupredoxin domain
MGEAGGVVPAGQGHMVLEFRLTGGAVADNSFDNEPVSFPHVPAGPNDAVFAPISLPDVSNVTPRITRTFKFERGGGGWQINGRFMDCTQFRLTPQINTAEKWIIQNNSGDWQHPIHIHMEEHRILKRNGVAINPGNVEFSRKDVMKLQHGESIEILMRFRDLRGGYPMHCHNTIHEDHQMMLLWEVADVGDNITAP